jgi:hypothetical protein
MFADLSYAAQPPAYSDLAYAAEPPAFADLAYAPQLPAFADLSYAAQPPATAYPAQPPTFADLAYAAQLLLQAGAWRSLLALYRNAGAPLQWSRLPQPLLCGLLQAPVSVREQWCSIYTGREHHYHTPDGPAEWLLYAAVASSCGIQPLLEPAAEQSLRQSGAGSRALLIGLGYHKLQQAAGAAPEIMPSGSIPWLLLLRSVLRGD